MLFIPNYFSSETDFHLDQQLKMLCSFNEHVPCNPQGEYAENNFKTLLQSLKTNKICESLQDSFEKQEFASKLMYIILIDLHLILFLMNLDGILVITYLP